MLVTETKTQVLIAGAGPTGLALACQFIRYGVDFIIVDQKETTTPYSKAIGVQARTLEIYEQIGLAQPLADMGTPVKGLRLIEGGQQRARVDLTKLGQGMSPYPYLLIVEQGKHEKLLYEFIRAHDKDVQWKTTLKGFSQNDRGVTASLTDATGTEQTIKAEYLVGADGAKSLIRHQLGMTFEGSTFERMFYVADVQIAWEFSHDLLTLCLARNNGTAFFPMPGENRYRIVGVFPEDCDKKEGEILYEEIEQQILKDTELKLDIYNVNWFSTYKVHSRRVNKFSEGRCFLAGDSAHIHSPAGAQGMNTGIQDGYNLAWKLALVVQGKANEKLLQTYNEERIVIATRLLETTDRLFDLFANPNWFVAFVRQHVFPYVANFVAGLDAANQFIFPLISQIGINYRHRSLSMDGAGDFEVQAGDRMPYFLVDGKSIYERLHAPSFHLVTFTNEPNKSGDNIESEFAPLIDHVIVPLTAEVSEAFGSSEPFTVLLRPDNYIALISAQTLSQPVKSYFEELIS